MPQTEILNLPLEGAITEGDDYPINLTITDGDGNAQDITDWTFWITIKEARDDTDNDAIIQEKVTSHTDAANGETRLVLEDTETAELDGSKFYDIQAKKADDTIQTLFKGRISFDWGATDSTT